MTRRCTASTLVLAAAAATTAAGLSPLASAVSQAQEPQPNVPVQERPRPAFDPLGIRLGNFLVFPRLEVTETYNSNVFADPDDEEDDLITVVEPTVSVRSNFRATRSASTPAPTSASSSIKAMRTTRTTSARSPAGST